MSQTDQEITTVEDYLTKVQELCGELCDYTKKVTPGKILGKVSAKVLNVKHGNYLKYLCLG